MLSLCKPLAPPSGWRHGSHTTERYALSFKTRWSFSAVKKGQEISNINHAEEFFFEEELDCLLIRDIISLKVGDIILLSTICLWTLPNSKLRTVGQLQPDIVVLGLWPCAGVVSFHHCLVVASTQWSVSPEALYPTILFDINCHYWMWKGESRVGHIISYDRIRDTMTSFLFRPL